MRKLTGQGQRSGSGSCPSGGEGEENGGGGGGGVVRAAGGCLQMRKAGGLGVIVDSAFPSHQFIMCELTVQQWFSVFLFF